MSNKRGGTLIWQVRVTQGVVCQLPLSIHLVVEIIGLTARAYSGLSIVRNYLFPLRKSALRGVSTQNDISGLFCHINVNQVVRKHFRGGLKKSDPLIFGHPK